MTRGVLVPRTHLVEAETYSKVIVPLTPAQYLLTRMRLDNMRRFLARVLRDQDTLAQKYARTLDEMAVEQYLAAEPLRLAKRAEGLDGFINSLGRKPLSPPEFVHAMGGVAVYHELICQEMWEERQDGRADAAPHMYVALMGEAGGIAEGLTLFNQSALVTMSQSAAKTARDAVFIPVNA